MKIGDQIIPIILAFELLAIARAGHQLRRPGQRLGHAGLLERIGQAGELGQHLHQRGAQRRILIGLALTCGPGFTPIQRDADILGRGRRPNGGEDQAQQDNPKHGHGDLGSTGMRMVPQPGMPRPTRPVFGTGRVGSVPAQRRLTGVKISSSAVPRRKARVRKRSGLLSLVSQRGSIGSK